MNSDVMGNNLEMVEKTNMVYGSNKIDYLVFTMGMCNPNQKVYGNGSLEESTHVSVNYDVTQSFPQDQFVAALKSTQTELPQVHGAPNSFKYCQSAFGVEFKISKMSGVDPTNINAGITKNLLKSYDSKAWNGDAGNAGIIDNPNGVYTSDTWSQDYASLKASFDAAMIRLRAALDITKDNYSSILFSYTAEIGNILSDTDNYNVSNMDKLQKSYPGVVFREIPSTLVNSGAVYTLSYTPLLTFHRGALPSIDGQETTNYGKTLGTLYAYESTAIEVEEKGALQHVTLTVTA